MTALVTQGRTETVSTETGAAGPVETVPSGPLGKNADFVVKSDFPPPNFMARSWYLRSYARDILKRSGVHKRLRWCGQKVSRGEMGVGIYARPDRGYGRFSGVCVCGQSLCCPVCAPRIASRRALDVGQAFEWGQRNGYDLRLLSYTMPHTLADGLGDLLDMQAQAWRFMQQDGSFKRHSKKSSVGSITAQEITWGPVHGWHPHKHQFRFDRVGTFNEDLHRASWLSALDTIGRNTKGAREHAFDVGAVGNEAGARYISKLATSVNAQANAIGLEVAGGSNKGRNIINMLADAAQGDEVAAAYWLTGVKEIIGRKVTSLRWSRLFRDLVGVGPERDDSEIAAEEVVETDIYLGQLNHHQWRIVVNARAESVLLICANQGLDSVNSFLRGLGAGELIEEPVEPSGRGSGVSDYEFLSSSQGGKAITTASLSLAQWQREIDKPAGLSRQQMAAMKD